MILLLGATGYIGQAFARELRRQGEPFIPLSRSAFDYSSFELLFDYVPKITPDLVINAAGFAGRPTEPASEPDRLEALQANTLLPQTIARVCVMLNTPWGHVSSGSIYSGARVQELRPGNASSPAGIPGRVCVEKDLTRPELLRAFAEHPERFAGFTERDEPNFCFPHPPCTFYSGSKALAEEAIRRHSQTYIWRMRLPFGQQDEPCNWLSQIQQSATVTDAVNSLSHLEDCVRACLQLWERRAAFGTYNVTNPGAVTTRQVADLIERTLKPAQPVRLARRERRLSGAREAVPQSNCILDVSKLLRTGVKLRPVTAALEDALEKWETVRATRRVDEEGVLV